jgi:hypothetical protein
MTIIKELPIACTLLRGASTELAQTTPSRCACSASQSSKGQGIEKAASITAATLATGAAACAACCILPFALPAAALASIGSIIALFEHAYRWMTDLASVVAIASWAWIAWQSLHNSRKPSTLSLSIMVMASGIITIALLWPLIERPIIEALRS